MGRLEEQVEKALKEREKGSSKHVIVKLPCGCTSVEITRPGDKYITCPRCGHSYRLTWSRLGRHKIEGER